MAGLHLASVGLRWQDVNLDAGVLSIQQVSQDVAGRGIIFKEPKTVSSRRSVALSPATVKRLREHKARYAEVRLPASTALVFATANVGPIDSANLRRAWKKLTRAARLPRLRFHDLRHAHATLLLANGANPRW